MWQLVQIQLTEILTMLISFKSGDSSNVYGIIVTFNAHESPNNA